MKKIGILFVLLALVACADGDKPSPPKEDAPTKPEVKLETLICPQVAILKEADEALDYGGEKPDPAQLVAKARLKTVTGDCAYRKEDKKGSGSGIDITFTLQAAAARGPRLGGQQVSFSYFIAVVDPAENILNRQIVTAEFKFSGDKQVAETFEPLHVFIPMPETSMPSGPDYRVLIGFTKPRT